MLVNVIQFILVVTHILVSAMISWRLIAGQASTTIRMTVIVISSNSITCITIVIFFFFSSVSYCDSYYHHRSSH